MGGLLRYFSVKAPFGAHMGPLGPLGPQGDPLGSQGGSPGIPGWAHGTHGPLETHGPPRRTQGGPLGTHGPPRGTHGGPLGPGAHGPLTLKSAEEPPPWVRRGDEACEHAK